jgi:hypothetical protein
MEYIVVQTVRVAGRARHIIRGVIRDVPEHTTARAVAGVIETAGYAPTEAGILWANHAVRAAGKLPDAERPAGEIPEWTWDELTAASDRPAQRQLNVRIPRKLYGECEAAAAAAGVKLRPWVESVLVAAISSADKPHPALIPLRRNQ